MGILLNFLLLIVGFFLLIKGADFLVNGASSLAKRFRISELAIGLTIVAFGTSAPELMVNGISSYEGYNEVVFGNIIGSNIMNLLLILGFAGTIYPLSVQSSTIKKEIPFSLFAVFLLLFLANDQFIFNSPESKISFWEAIVMLIFFGFFILNVMRNLRTNLLEELDGIKVYPIPKTTLLLLGGLLALGLGGKLVVDNGVALARYYAVSEKLIGLTIIAMGTSLPELATSVVASIKKRSDIAIGNVVGSNIFNLLLILPISALISPLSFPTILSVDLFILAGGTILLISFMFTSTTNQLDRWEAIFFLLSFTAYMVYLILRK